MLLLRVVFDVIALPSREASVTDNSRPFACAASLLRASISARISGGASSIEEYSCCSPSGPMVLMLSDSLTMLEPGLNPGLRGDADVTHSSDSLLYHGLCQRGTVKTATMPPPNPQSPSQIKGMRT